MSSPIVAKNSAVRLPSAAADTTGKRGVYRIAVSTTAASYAVPAGMKGNFVKISAVGANCQIAFSTGAAGQTLVINQTSALGTGNAAAGATVANGSFVDGIVAKDFTFFNVVADAAGFVELYCSEALNQAVGFSG